MPGLHFTCHVLPFVQANERFGEGVDRGLDDWAFGQEINTFFHVPGAALTQILDPVVSITSDPTGNTPKSASDGVPAFTAGRRNCGPIEASPDGTRYNAETLAWRSAIRRTKS